MLSLASKAGENASPVFGPGQGIPTGSPPCLPTHPHTHRPFGFVSLCSRYPIPEPAVIIGPDSGDGCLWEGLERARGPKGEVERGEETLETHRMGVSGARCLEV